MIFQSISPGFVQTEMVLPEHTEVLKDAPYMRPEDISQAVLYVLGTAPNVQVGLMKIFIFKSKIIFFFLFYT